MRFLFFLFFVIFATNASAQWQTKLGFEVFSLTDPGYRQMLATEKSATGHDWAKRAKLGFMLSNSDPIGYGGFVANIVRGLTGWRDAEIKKGDKCPFYGRLVSVAFTPYGMSPVPGDVQVTVVWTNAMVGGESTTIMRAASIKIADGVDKAINDIKLLVTMPAEKPFLLPTSRKLAQHLKRSPHRTALFC